MWTSVSGIRAETGLARTLLGPTTVCATLGLSSLTTMIASVSLSVSSALVLSEDRQSRWALSGYLQPFFLSSLKAMGCFEPFLTNPVYHGGRSSGHP